MTRLNRFLRAPRSVVPLLLLALAPAAEPCAILTLRDDALVLMGNNEDYVEPGYVWFVPARKGRLGRVNVGFADGFAQGGMNEKGLAFDAAVVAEVPWSPDPDKPSPKNLIEQIMDTCGTVEEAIARFQTHNCSHLARSQFLFADASGDSAVIAWLPDRGLSVERIEGRQQIATNTRLAPSGYRCQRHVRAEQVLAERGDVSLATVAATLDAIHQHGPGAFTSYSTIYDLRARRLYLYNLADFGTVVSFDLALELNKKRARYELAALFEGSELGRLRDQPQREDYGTRVTLPEPLLDRYAGTYAPSEAPDVRVRVLRDGDGLRVVNPDRSEARLFPESERSFRIAPDRGTVTFELDADGRVSGLTLHRQADLFARRVGALEDGAP